MKPHIRIRHAWSKYPHNGKFVLWNARMDRGAIKAPLDYDEWHGPDDAMPPRFVKRALEVFGRMVRREQTQESYGGTD